MMLTYMISRAFPGNVRNFCMHVPHVNTLQAYMWTGERNVQRAAATMLTFATRCTAAQGSYLARHGGASRQHTATASTAEAASVLQEKDQELGPLTSPLSPSSAPMPLLCPHAPPP